MNAFDDLTANGFREDQLTRFINVYMYAWWYSSGYTSREVNLSLQYWLGGSIVSTRATKPTDSVVAYVYSNPTGVNKNPDPNPEKLISPIKYGNGSTNLTTIMGSSGMNKIARIRYDRITHKATPIWYTASDLPNWPTSNVALPQTMSTMAPPYMMPEEEIYVEDVKKE